MRVSTKARMSPARALRIVVDAAQQHRLADHDDAGIDQPGAGRARLRREFTRMVGVKGHIGGLARRFQGSNQRSVHVIGLHHRHAGMKTDDLDVLDRQQAACMISSSRRGDSTSGSPPVRITSQISGRPAI